MTSMQILGLLGPVLVLVFALIIMALTRWQDEREERRQARKRGATPRPGS